MNGLAVNEALDEAGRSILAAWQEAHGVAQGCVAVSQLGEHYVTVYIENGLAVGERRLGETAKGHDLLKEYARRLMEPICEAGRVRVATAVNRAVSSVQVQVDPAAGVIICLFRLC